MHQRHIPLNSRIPALPDETDQFIDLERLAAMGMRRARIVGLCALIGLALGIAYLVFTPAQYTASTRILLDEGLTRFAEDERTPASARAQAESMILSEVEILKSTRLARAVAIAEKLHEDEDFLNPPRLPIPWLKSQVKAVLGMFASSPPADADGSVEEARIGKAAALLQNAISAERVGRSSVIEVLFTAYDRALAGSITRAYARAYLADQLEANFDATQQATVWLQGRLAELHDSSQAAAREVERFRAEHGLTSARGELMSEQQLSDLNSQLILAQAETANALARYNQYKSIVDSGPQEAVSNATIPPDQANSSTMNDLKARYLNVTRREQDIADRFGEDHPQAVALRREQTELTRQVFRELQQLTEGYRKEYEIALSREKSLRANVGQMEGESSQTGQALVRLRDLEQKAATLATLYQSFLTRYEEASQQRSLPIAKARVISEAANPVSPSSPRKSMVLGLSLALGLFAGGVVAALQEFLERFFRTGDDVRAALDLKFFGYLPIVGQGKPASDPKAGAGDGKMAGDSPPNGTATVVAPRILRVAIDAPSSSFAETLRNVAIATDLVLQRGPGKVIGFVSVLPGEGKTTVAANFAGLLAANGARTLLIDGDLRNPGLSRGLSLTTDKGLVEAIIGDQRWTSTVRVDRGTRLAIIPAVVRGRLSHTSELLSSSGMRDIIEEARKTFSYIVVDLPPLGPVVDAKAFEPLADGFVMVTEWGATPRAMVRSALQAEPQIAAKILGLVLNKTDMKQLGRYGALGGPESYLERYSAYYVDKSAMAGRS
jgi:succinoglycan biosynthesis transport protein ExoP